MVMRMQLGEKLSDFASCYDIARPIWTKRVGLPENHTRLLDDPFKAIIFFTNFVHERAGVNPRFALYHRLSLRIALDGREFKQALFCDEKFPASVWKEFNDIVQRAHTKPNAKITKGPVKEILEKMRTEKEANLIVLLKKKPLLEAYKWLKSVRGIGPKIATLFLRDIWSFIGAWQDTPRSDLYCLQPIDRWVRFWSRECWPHKDWPSSDEKFAKMLVSACQQMNIDPVSFNKGAWFVGSHFDSLCDLFNVPEQEQIHMSNCVLNYIRSDKVVNAIRKFDELYEQQIVFPV